MSVRLGAFQFMYSTREQKIRDTMQHLIHKYGIVKARMMVNEEYLKTYHQCGGGSEQCIWWNDVRWHLKSHVHSLNYGFEKGL